MVFKYIEDGWKMFVSVGYIVDVIDYNVNLDGINLVVEISGSGE